MNGLMGECEEENLEEQQMGEYRKTKESGKKRVTL